MYKPSFSITMLMLNKVINITKKIGLISTFDSLNGLPILRRNNNIKSIYSSLAIEANSLSFEQVKDIINGKLVFGPKNEVTEVKNAYDAYNLIDKYDPFSEQDLIKAHKLLTKNLVEDVIYRKHPEGVFDGEKVVFVAPPHDIVPQLMYDLFQWLKEDLETPMLIKSAIFHYEFVFIHPFSDGNGRTARLWQTVLLNTENEVFKYLPIENQILRYQKEYYDAINVSNSVGNSNAFIEFMLNMLDETLEELLISLNRVRNNISIQVKKLLDVMDDNIAYSAIELMSLLNVKSRDTLRNSYLRPALENNLIKRTIEDKKHSKSQKYIKL